MEEQLKKLVNKLRGVNVRNRKPVLAIEELLKKLDWKVIEQQQVFTRADIETILELERVDPTSMVMRMRKVLERIVRHLHQSVFKTTDKRSLGDMLFSLNERGVFPKNVYVFFNAIRLSGNYAAHEDEHTKADVSALAPLFVRAVEWFVDTHLVLKPPKRQDIDAKHLTDARAEEKAIMDAARKEAVARATREANIADAQARHQRGREAIARGNYDMAVRELEAAIRAAKRAQAYDLVHICEQDITRASDTKARGASRAGDCSTRRRSTPPLEINRSRRRARCCCASSSSTTRTARA